MRKFLLTLTLLLTIGLMACSKDKTVTCESNENVIEWTWNEDDGFIELKTDGVLEDESVVDRMNEVIEESEYSSVVEFMEFFVGIAESEGYVCD